MTDTPPPPPREMSLYLKDSATGENAPLAVLHSTDINRSSQDTQQLRASQTEPVRHRAGGWLVGGSTTRHNSLFFFFSSRPPSLLTMGRSGTLQCQKKAEKRQLPGVNLHIKEGIYIKLRCRRRSTTLLLKAPFPPHPPSPCSRRHVLGKLSDSGWPFSAGL